MSWISKLIPGVVDRSNKDYDDAQELVLTVKGYSVNELTKNGITTIKSAARNLDGPLKSQDNYITYETDDGKAYMEVIDVTPETPVEITDDTKIRVVDTLYHNEEENRFDVEDERLVEVEELPVDENDVVRVNSVESFENVLNQTGMNDTVYHVVSEDQWLCNGKLIELDSES